MKKNKILYILIGAFCVLAIIAGVYAQFLVKGDKNDIIVPNFNNVEDNTVTEKTSEEIKNQFTNLFTNVLNSGNYDTSNIERINTEKDIVYSAYDIEEKKDNYEINIHLPVMNIKGEVPTNFNNITQTIFADKASDILSNKNSKNTIYQINYVAYINENILSLIIEGTLKEGNNPQRVIVQTYNYNLATGEKVEINDLFLQKNLVQSEVQDKIYSIVEKEEEKAKVLMQSGYTVYSRDISSEIYQISNISNYFLGPNGNLYIVFAYGNQNFTSEMDIVLYE